MQTFVTLADSLVTGFDTIDVLQMLVERTTSLFDASDAGIILVGSTGDLEVIASTNERSKLVGLLQLRAGEGPCVESYSTGTVVSVPDLGEIDDRWPVFADLARDSGYGSVHAIPLRLRDQTLGSLNLFRDSTGTLNEDDATAAQALADVATISILQERALREVDSTREQLQRALDGRVVIEQAKGVVSYTQSVDMDEAFQRIRRHARSNRLPLVEVAAAVVARRLTV
nr:GAF and ANTAR domain-containing protein [Frigoribacterium sp. VKM Ac-2836]